MKKTAIIFLIVLWTMGGHVSAFAQNTTISFMNKVPSSQELIEALSLPEKSRVRTRGIHLNLPNENKQITPMEESAAKETPRRVALDVKFKYDSDCLTNKAKQTLQALGNALNSDKLRGGTFILEGHTDAQGSQAYNLELSQRRAVAVEKYLLTTCHVSDATFIVKGYGETRLLVNEHPESSENRRVEVVNVSQ